MSGLSVRVPQEAIQVVALAFFLFWAMAVSGVALVIRSRTKREIEFLMNSEEGISGGEWMKLSQRQDWADTFSICGVICALLIGAIFWETLKPLL